MAPTIKTRIIIATVCAAVALILSLSLGETKFAPTSAAITFILMFVATSPTLKRMIREQDEKLKYEQEIKRDEYVRERAREKARQDERENRRRPISTGLGPGILSVGGFPNFKRKI